MLSASDISHVVRDPSGDVGVLFERLNVHIEPAEIVGLLGSSGCGKTTLVRMLAGFTSPREGTVLCDGEPVVQPASPVAIVSQDYKAAVFPWMTVEANLALGLRKAGKKGRGELLGTAKQLGISHLLHRYPGALSGGERQRVQIGRTLLMGARYLLLDEPSSSLDLELRRTLLELLAEVIEQYGCGILLVTHNIDEAVYVSDRLYLARRTPEGRLQLEHAEAFRRAAKDLGMAHKCKAFQDTYDKIYHDLFSRAAA